MDHPYTRAAAIALAAALLVPTAALANKGDKGDKFAQMDSNSDGRISSQESASGASDMFTRMDADGDGRLTAAEMDAHKASKGKTADRGKSAEKIAKVDSDGDGVLTAQEHASGAREMFARMDANSDGSVSSTEMDDAERTAMREDDQRTDDTAQQYD